MSSLRQWQLSSTEPYALQLAADARLSQTSYVDDQSWELSPGAGDAPALALQTRYGGRVGLASLVPMWMQQGRLIYQAQTYAQPPVVTAFAPGYLQAVARLTPELTLLAEYWVMESQSVGGRFTLHNTGKQVAELRLDLFGHVATDNKQLPTAIISLVDETNALSLGRLSGLEPVVLLENARAEIVPGRKASPKIGTDIEILPGEAASLRWVHSGLSRMAISLERAQFWLAQDWDAAFEQIEEAAQAIPDIETGDLELDATLAFSYQQLVQSVLNPTEHLPYASFVASRQPGRGYSPRGDGTDYDRGWNGQLPQAAYLVASALATIHPQAAQGILLNYLAVQQPDGWIDAKPGLGGQKQDLLCPPLLARLAWNIYAQTQDKTFLKEVFARLTDFFNRWSEVDLDVDGDILPEWQDERQTGYVFWPTFGVGQSWAQNTVISSVETPDMAAYLLSEAASLKQIALALENPGAYEFDQRMADMSRLLNRLWWNDSRYAYSDRDTDKTFNSMSILEDAPGDEEHIIPYPLDVPSRLIIRVVGGTGRAPRATLYLEGQDAAGQAITETVDLRDFTWTYNNGTFTSNQVYTMVDRIRFEGLSRVYRANVYTTDLTRLDINAMMPLWWPDLPEDRAAALVKLVMDPQHFLRPGGLTIVSAQDDSFDPSSARGGGGTWAYWTTVIGEGLLAHGYVQEAQEITERLLKTQTEVLKKQNRFSEFYHSDEPVGLGESGFVSGIAPLHLFMRLIGVRVLNSGQVWTGGAFGWSSPVTVKQHGVTIRRAAAGTEVIFPSRHTVHLAADAAWQAVVDPSPITPGASPAIPQPPQPPSPAAPGRVIIEVDHND